MGIHLGCSMPLKFPSISGYVVSGMGKSVVLLICSFAKEIAVTHPPGAKPFMAFRRVKDAVVTLLFAIHITSSI
jgi:hypothetical protein